MGRCSVVPALALLLAFSCLLMSPAGAMVGGKSETDMNSPEVTQAAQQAVALLNHGEAQKLQVGSGSYACWTWLHNCNNLSRP